MAKISKSRKPGIIKLLPSQNKTFSDSEAFGPLGKFFYSGFWAAEASNLQSFLIPGRGPQSPQTRNKKLSEPGIKKTFPGPKTLSQKNLRDLAGRPQMARNPE